MVTLCRILHGAVVETIIKKVTQNDEVDLSFLILDSSFYYKVLCFAAF